MPRTGMIAREPAHPQNVPQPLSIVPAQRQFQPSNIHGWSHLRDINIRVPPQTVNPWHFGKGAQFWLEDGRQMPPHLRLAALPDRSSAQCLSKLYDVYGPVATNHYLKAREEAADFAHLGGGVAVAQARISPRRVARVREQLYQALVHAPKFAEAWILLARTIAPHERAIKIDGSQSLPADFVRALAAVMAKPFHAPVLMQLMAVLPTGNQALPSFMKVPKPGQGPSMPLDKKRLAIYLLRFVDPTHEAALGALAECGGRVRLGKLLPVRQPERKRYLEADDVGAMAAMRMGELWPLMSSSQLADTKRNLVAVGCGAFLTKAQFSCLIQLETEEEDPNLNQALPQGEEGDFMAVNRNQARAIRLNELAQTLPNGLSWLYVPNHMLMNGLQMRALARTYQGFTGAFDALRQACGDGRSAPIPVYRKTVLSAQWINFYEKVMRGESDPGLYRDLVRDAEQLPERSINQDQPYVMILGQAYSKTELLLRADLFENRQKPVTQQSAVPALKLYLHCINDIALHSKQNPVKAKRQPFVMNVGTQMAIALVQLLNEPVLMPRSQRTLENKLIRAVRDLLVNFNEERTAPFRTLTDDERNQDDDFRRALAVIDLYGSMLERCQALEQQYQDRLTLSQYLASRDNVPLPQTQFPALPAPVTPDICDACRESDQTPDNPLLLAPFDSGGHRLCLAEKMVKTGQPDLRGMLQASPSLAFLSWTDQARAAIHTLSRFIGLRQRQPQVAVGRALVEAAGGGAEPDLEAGLGLAFNDAASVMSTDSASDSDASADSDASSDSEISTDSNAAMVD